VGSRVSNSFACFIAFFNLFYISFFLLLSVGVVTREAPKSPVKALERTTSERTEGGVITYGIGNNKKTIMYFLKDCEKPPRIGDNVKFNICQVRLLLRPI